MGDLGAFMSKHPKKCMVDTIILHSLGVLLSNDPFWPDRICPNSTNHIIIRLNSKYIQ